MSHAINAHTRTHVEHTKRLHFGRRTPQAVNARERELLAELQVQLSARQSAIDEGLHVAEHSWRSLTQVSVYIYILYIYIYYIYTY
jgi:hypothetical protein